MGKDGGKVKLFAAVAALCTIFLVLDNELCTCSNEDLPKMVYSYMSAKCILTYLTLGPRNQRRSDQKRHQAGGWGRTLEKVKLMSVGYSVPEQGSSIRFKEGTHNATYSYVGAIYILGPTVKVGVRPPFFLVGRKGRDARRYVVETVEQIHTHLIIALPGSVVVHRA